jgi:beta-galactosidase beta subunit
MVTNQFVGEFFITDYGLDFFIKGLSNQEISNLAEAINSKNLPKGKYRINGNSIYHGSQTSLLFEVEEMANRKEKVKKGFKKK